jgi:4'-phosphopantetheinyl transferase
MDESPPFDDDVELRPNEIHVVRFCLDRTFDAALGGLDEVESERARRFVFDADRRRFISAHAFVRRALGRCLRQSPTSLRFVTDRCGKPRLLNPSIDLRFNLSHAGERALLAVTIGREVGVDIEQRRPIAAIDVARAFFADSEYAELARLHPSEQIDAFYRCWTRKEAFIKALGKGLVLPLNAFEVDLTCADSTQALRTCRDMAAAVQRWRIVPLQTEAGYAAALAAEAGDWTIVHWNGT